MNFADNPKKTSPWAVIDIPYVRRPSIRWAATFRIRKADYEADMKHCPILPFVPQDISAVPVEVKQLGTNDFGRELSLHGHAFFELLLITCGEGFISLDGVQHRVAPGHVFVIPPYFPHDVSALGHSTGWALLFLPNGTTETAAKTSGLSLLDDIPLGMTFDLFRSPQLGGSQLLLTGDSLSTVEGIFERIHSELHNRPSGYEFAVRAAVQLMLVEVGRATRSSTERLGGSENADDEILIGRAFADIDAHFSARATLGKAARRLGVSAGHLTTRLRRLTGRTYGEWVVERRMMEARHRLACSNQDMADVAESLGYRSQESFIRRFRAHHSTTPGRWREKARRNRLLS